MEYDITKIRQIFPVTQERVYFAINAVAPLPIMTAEVIHQTIDLCTKSDITNLYIRQNVLKSECRELFANLIGCSPSEIAFTRNTSEGILWLSNSLDWKNGDEVILINGDFPTLIYPWKVLENIGVKVKIIPTIDNRIMPEMIAKALNNRTRVLALSSVQWNTGFRSPIREIGGICHENGTLLLVDACLSLGAIPIDVYQDNIDILVTSCYKYLLGMMGLGVFFCRQDMVSKLNDYHTAWGSIKYNGFPWRKASQLVEQNYPFNLKDDVSRFEEGSNNLLAIKAQIASLKLINEIGIKNIEIYLKEITDYMVVEADKKGCTIISPRNGNEWSSLVMIKSNKNETALIYKKLSNNNISLSNLNDCLLFAFGIYNNKEEIDKVLSFID